MAAATMHSGQFCSSCASTGRIEEADLCCLPVAGVEALLFRLQGRQICPRLLFASDEIVSLLAKICVAFVPLIGRLVVCTALGTLTTGIKGTLTTSTGTKGLVPGFYQVDTACALYSMMVKLHPIMTQSQH